MYQGLFIAKAYTSILDNTYKEKETPTNIDHERSSVF